MLAANLTVCRIGSTDHDILAPLWVSAVSEDGHRTHFAERQVTEGRLANALAREEVSIYLARVDDVPAGFAVLTLDQLSGLTVEPTLWLEQLWVVPEMRRRGVSRALLAAAVSRAEQVGATALVSCVPAAGRDEQRFFARLGFGPFVNARSVTPAALRRRLATDDHRESVTTALVRRRRSLRARAALPRL